MDRANLKTIFRFPNEHDIRVVDLLDGFGANFVTGDARGIKSAPQPRPEKERDVADDE